MAQLSENVSSEGIPLAERGPVKIFDDPVNVKLQSIAEKDHDVVPIGKSATENIGDDDEDDEEDDADVDDESDTNDDDELDTDMIDERDSPDDADMEGNEMHSDSPPWGL